MVETINKTIFIDYLLYRIVFYSCCNFLLVTVYTILSGGLWVFCFNGMAIAIQTKMGGKTGWGREQQEETP